MDLKKRVDEVMAKPVDRRQFLAQTGAVLLAVVGVSAVLKSLGLDSAKPQAKGYGSSPYGGSRERRG